MKIAVVTISDSCSAGTAEDVSGPTLVEAIKVSTKVGSAAAERVAIIPDDVDQIEQMRSLDVILTTGGTGWAARDVTPEAVKRVIERQCTGLEAALHFNSLKATPFAALSRLTAGIRGSTLIVCLPGSKKAVKECWEVLEPIISHGVGLLHDSDQTAKHKEIQTGK